MAQWQRICLLMQEIWVWSLGWEDPPGGRNGNPLQYSCLENSMDQGAWWAVHGVVKNQTQLSMHTLYYGAVSSFPAYTKFAFYVEDVIYHGYLGMGKIPFPYPSWISRVYCIIVCFDKKLIPRFSYFLHCELYFSPLPWEKVLYLPSRSAAASFRYVCILISLLPQPLSNLVVPGSAKPRVVCFIL